MNNRQVELEAGIAYITENELQQKNALKLPEIDVKSRGPYYQQDKWDLRFLKMAELVGLWSKDPSTKTGAVIVRPDRSVCSVGFNGFPKEMPDIKINYENRDEKYSRIVHCEMNALLFSRECVDGYTLYTWPYASCDRCCVHMLQAGIKRFVFPVSPEDKKIRWAEALQRTKNYIEECKCEWAEWDNYQVTRSNSQ